MTNQFSTQVCFGRKSHNESSILCGEPTLKEAVTETIKNMKYYLTLEPGMKIGNIEIRQACLKCAGNGSIRTKRTIKTCVKCDGSGYPKVLFSMTGTLELPIEVTR